MGSPGCCSPKSGTWRAWSTGGVLLPWSQNYLLPRQHDVAWLPHVLCKVNCSASAGSSSMWLMACCWHRVYLLGGANASGQPNDTVVYYVYGDVAPSDNSGGQRRGLGAISYMALAPGYFWSDSLFPPGQLKPQPCLFCSILIAPYMKGRDRGAGLYRVLVC